MITRNRMKFMAPEGDAGGGTAVAEPEPMGSVGEAYTAALNKHQSPEPSKDAPKPVATEPEAPKAAAPKESEPAGATEPAAPASALDAALEGTSATGAPGPAEKATEDYLKDIPELLPKEGRKENWARARGAISKLGETVTQRDQRISELTKEVETAKATPAGSSEQIVALQKQLDEYKDAVVAINVEYDPVHREKFITGRTNLIAKAASKLNAFGGKGELITTALEMPESRARNMAIKEALAELEPVEQNRVMQFVGDVEKLDDEKAEIMKDPQGAWSKLQESEKARATEAAKKAEEFKHSVFDTVAKRLPETLFLLREVNPALPGAVEHNANAKAMREAAFKLLGTDAKPEDLVEAAFWKQAGPKVQELFVGSRKELAVALEALKKYEAAEPGYRGGAGPKKTTEEEKLDKEPGQIYRETIAKFAGGED